MKAFHESLRYEYNLNPDSIVIDAGGYMGQWFSEIFKKYGCNIYVFEPIYRHNLECMIKAHDIGGREKIRVFDYALAGRVGGCLFNVNGDSTGRFASGGTDEHVNTIDFASWMVTFDQPIDLLKLNIEGMEFEVLERLIETGEIKRIKNIQVQFHLCYPDFKARYAELRQKLCETHEPEWDNEPDWQNWKLKCQP